MCGIVYDQSFDGSPVNNAILQQFDLQRHRGTQGFGLFDGMKKNLVRAANENKILKWLVNYDSDLIMFHHRFPTSTVNVKRAAHPFSTKDYFGKNQYIMVHNGSVSNAKELKEKHEKLGITYQSQLSDGTFNDSEALLWDLALTLQGRQDELKAWGGIAFVCVKLYEGQLDKLFFGRNYSKPLNMTYTHNRLSLSSEGEGDEIKTHTLHTFNYKLKRLTKKDFQIPAWNGVTTYSGNACGYSGYADGRYDDYDWGGFSGYSATKGGLYLPRGENYDYDRDGNPIYPPDDGATQLRRQMALAYGDDTLGAAIERHEVQTIAMEYITQARGSFEAAYWLAEDDYMDMFDNDGEGDRETVALQEKVLEYIYTDPEYVDIHSKCSLYMAIEGDEDMELIHA